MNANGSRGVRLVVLVLVALGVLASWPAVVAGGDDGITLTIVSDANNEFSSDAGVTWHPVTLPTPHGLYATPIGSSSWISFDPQLATQTAVILYRETFDLPPGCHPDSASLSVTLHVDNDASVFLNDSLTPFGATPTGSLVSNFQDPAEGPYVTTGPFLETGNTLIFSVRDYGLPSALDYQAVLTCDLNQPPTANAGPDQTVTETSGGTSVTLDGTGSTDPDGDALSYSWTGPFTGGTATGATPTVTFASAGSHTVTLTVDDGNGGTDTDEVLITVQAATPSPTPSPTASPTPAATATPRGAALGSTPTPASSAVPNTAVPADVVDVSGWTTVTALLLLVSANALALARVRPRR